MLLQTEHFLFFPVIVLVALILIVLSFRVLFRLFIFFLIIIAIWYALYHIGVTESPPVEKAKPSQERAANVYV